MRRFALFRFVPTFITVSPISAGQESKQKKFRGESYSIIVEDTASVVNCLFVPNRYKAHEPSLYTGHPDATT